jgi:hypothetical protein
MEPHQYFERNTEGPEWSEAFRRGFDDGYEGRAFTADKPTEENDTEEGWQYEQGYVEGGFARLEEKQPGVMDAMSYVFVSHKFSDWDICKWLDSDPTTRFYGEAEEYRPIAE